MTRWLCGLILVGSAACTRSDSEHARQVVKKELKNDAAFVKQEALKAREATQKGVAKVKKDMKEQDRENKSSNP